jgi:hypothetical protein
LPIVAPKVDTLPMILFCNFESKLNEAVMNPCSMFHPVSTVNGICQSFNFEDDFEEETDFWLKWNSVFKVTFKLGMNMYCEHEPYYELFGERGRERKRETDIYRERDNKRVLGDGYRERKREKVLVFS